MTNLKIKRTKLNFILTLINVIVTALIGVLIPRFILVTYGSSINGLTNSINQFIVYLSLFEAGIGTTATQALYKPVADNNANDINSIISAMNKRYKKIGFFYSIALLLLSTIYPLLFIKEGMLGLNYFIIFLCVLLSGLGNVVLFFGQGKYRILLSVEGKGYVLTIIQTTLTIAIAISKIILINLGMNVVWIFGVTFAINLFQAIIIIAIIKTKYKWIDLKYKSSDISFKQSPYVFVSQVAWLIFQNIDILLLTIFCDVKIVSVYSIYKLVSYNIGQLLEIPLTSSSFAFGQIYNTDLKKFNILFRTAFIGYYCICFAIQAIVLWLYLPFLSLYTAGVTDAQYINFPLALLFVAVELLSFIRKPLMNVISYAGHFKATTKQTIIEMIINLIVSIILVIFLGIYGVLIGTIVALIYRDIDLILYVNHHLLHTKINLIISSILINACAFIFTYYALSRFYSGTIKNYFQFVKYGFFGVAFSLFVSIAINYLFLGKFIDKDIIYKIK